MKSAPLIVALITVLLSGCAYNASPYGASLQNVEAIKSLQMNAVSVDRFDSTQPGLDSIVCRAAGPVKVEPSFETYIENAFIDELKLAGVYDPASSIKLSGKLEKIDYSSGMTDGKWQFTLTLSNSKKSGFTISSETNFSGSFVADKACQEVAQKFGPAVQKLIREVITDPQFKAIAM